MKGMFMYFTPNVLMIKLCQFGQRFSYATKSFEKLLVIIALEPTKDHYWLTSIGWGPMKWPQLCPFEPPIHSDKSCTTKVFHLSLKELALTLMKLKIIILKSSKHLQGRWCIWSSKVKLKMIMPSMWHLAKLQHVNTRSIAFWNFTRVFSNQMAKIVIGINIISHEDQSPKMLFWPCHLPLMVTNNDQIVGLRY